MLNSVKSRINKYIQSVVSASPVVPSEDEVAMIDPEDYQLNTIINERGYSARYAFYAEDHSIDMSWAQDFSDLPELFCSLDEATDKKTGTKIFGIRLHELEDAIIVSFVSHTNTCYFHVWSNSFKTSKFWADIIKYKYVSDQPIEVFNEATNTRTVTFWGNGGHGYSATEKKIVMLPWNEEVEANYPKAVLDELGVLHDLEPPIIGGRIILMWGLPGTGKTSLIRTLAAHWTKWCHISIITDPEVFLGAAAAGMTVLTYDFSRYIDKDVPEEKAYHMLVIEDAGELLEKDAHGAGFSRLLNMADGMLGQATNLIICITTNKNIHEIHDAISRPGRCIANINFSEFTREEAEHWLYNFNAELIDEYKVELAKVINVPGHSTNVTLAELYHVVSKQKQIIRSKELVSHGTYL